jgi:hypothetical protein
VMTLATDDVREFAGIGSVSSARRTATKGLTALVAVKLLAGDADSLDLDGEDDGELALADTVSEEDDRLRLASDLGSELLEELIAHVVHTLDDLDTG